MNWIPLKDEAGLAAVKSQSTQQLQVIFKHSTRCATSSMIKNRLEKAKAPVQIIFHFFDLIANRSLSNQIAEDFGIAHQSPQILIIKNGECVYDESHTGISMDEIIAVSKL